MKTDSKITERARALEPTLTASEIDGLHDRSNLVTQEIAMRLRANDLVYYGPMDVCTRCRTTMVMAHRTALGAAVVEAARDRQQFELVVVALRKVGT